MRSVELFAGCGGLALGLAQAGFRHEMIVELDDHAAATLERNKKLGVQHFASWPIEKRDVRQISYSGVRGQIDLVAGGPPCQPFSIGGRHLGPQDDRNLWPEAIRAVRELKPRCFVFENVRGLLRPAFEPYLEYIELSLRWPDLKPRKDEDWEAHLVRLRKHAKGRNSSKAVYNLVVKGIDAADFGAPQRRHRVLVVGVRADVASDWSFPAPTHSRTALLWEQHISGGYWRRHGLPQPPVPARDTRIVDSLRRTNTLLLPAEEPWLTVRDALRGLPVPTKEAEPLKGHRLRPGARQYRKHLGSAWDQPAKALKAGAHGVPGGENMLALGEGEVRYFTLREMARLQGFPDEFDIGTGWKGPIRQLGNAVPVQIGQCLGAWLAGLLAPKKGGRQEGARAA
jgi:DNA (cytosine-5)-methyltransferase 1